MQTHILEPSLHLHTLQASEVKILKKTNEYELLEVQGNGLILHGEHGTLVTKEKYLVKYNQQELNPITNYFENVFD